jgi:hypothetical protein
MVLSYASPQEHHAEEIDPRTGRHLVNLSQTFTHLALINAVMHVVVTERAAQTASRAAANRLFFRPQRRRMQYGRARNHA